ncbi:hypothetical protein SDC9_121655 [bioreactor metagenome]|uniref:Uncharacterized protein n=1 Tax=bioreactor metagenome TaxID=1076179 RepID=A0A645CCI2_9ZZZZ
MDGADQQVTLGLVVVDGEQAHVAHEPGAEELAHEALVLEVLHGVVQRRQPGRARDVGKPAPVLVGRLSADALNIAVHRKAQRIRVDAAVRTVPCRRLVDHIGVR